MKQHFTVGRNCHLHHASCPIKEWYPCTSGLSTAYPFAQSAARNQITFFVHIHGVLRKHWLLVSVKFADVSGHKIRLSAVGCRQKSPISNDNVEQVQKAAPYRTQRDEAVIDGEALRWKCLFVTRVSHNITGRPLDLMIVTRGLQSQYLRAQGSPLLCMNRDPLVRRTRGEPRTFHTKDSYKMN